MNSARTLLVMSGLILGLNLGLRRPGGLAERPDPMHPAEVEGPWGSVGSLLSDPTAASDPFGRGSDARGRGLGSSRWRRAPGSEVPPSTSPTDPRPQDLLPPDLPTPELPTPDLLTPDLLTLVQGLESALTLDEQATWADRIAQSGGPAAVEALVRASLQRRSFEEAEVLHEAFKGFSTEPEMEAVAIGLLQTDDPDLIEALLETLARGARASTVAQLARLHEEASASPATRAVLGWAIERIRNPEAAEALGRWVGAAEPPDWTDAGIIALVALQSQADATVARSP